MHMLVHYTEGLTQVLRLPATHLRMLRDQCALAEQQPGEAAARDSVMMESTWRAGAARGRVQNSDLVEHRTLGVGRFGRVRLVQHEATGAVYALKMLGRRAVVESGQDAGPAAQRPPCHRMPVSSRDHGSIACQ